MFLTKISENDKNHLLEKIPYKIENIHHQNRFILNFTFGSENLVEIDWYLVEIKQVYDIEIIFNIWKHASCSKNMGQMKRDTNFSENVY